MAEVALEESVALAAIYCGKEEEACEVLEVSETEGISLRIQTCVKIPRGPDIVLKLLFHLPIGYPSRLPSVSVNSEQLTKAQCMVVKEKLLDEARRRLSQPMVHELILWIHQNLKRIVGNAEASTCCGKETLSTRRIDDAGVWTILLHFNHMRAKGKYIKTVGKWCTDLQLNGRLMFLGKVILMLLQGDRSSIKEYLIRQRAIKVDMDSSGKKCKEKMISVLSETKARADHRRFQAFEVKEYSTLDELQNEFKAAGLTELFSEFVLALLK